MKLKTAGFDILFALTVIVYSIGCQTKNEEEKKLSMLRTFYTNYITAISEGPIESSDSIRNSFCTQSLITQINKDDNLDYDPLINAQDADKRSLKTLKIRRDSLLKDWYIVKYSENHSQQTVKIKLMVVKENDNYKIDSIW